MSRRKTKKERDREIEKRPLGSERSGERKREKREKDRDTEC